MKYLLSTQAVAFFDCIWSTYELFSTSITFFASAHFNGIFHPGDKLMTVEIPGTDDGVQKTYIWTVSIVTLIISIVWVDSSLQLLIGTRQAHKVNIEELERFRYWLHLSYALLFLFAFKTYSNTGYVSAFIFSCVALLYRGAAIYIVHEKMSELENQIESGGGLLHSRLHESDSYALIATDAV